MEILPTTHPEVLLLRPPVFTDARGSFVESYNRRRYAEFGITCDFVQDNLAHSRRGVLRGLHYQLRQPQGKLLRVLRGAIFDVAVDLRRSSPHFGRVAAFTLAAESGCSAWIPPGFAHGYLALTDTVELLYKVSDDYAPEHERCLAWNDPALAIAWPLAGPPLLSDKDARGLPLAACELYP